MGKRKRDALPASLVRLESRFKAWRSGRTFGQRIPERLWSAAAKVAAVHGVCRTASCLQLDYYGLKKRVVGSTVAHNGASQDAFVELPSVPYPLVRECRVELQNGNASMRMHLKGSDIPDLVALAHDFWEST